MSLLFKNYSFVGVIYLLIWLNKPKSFLWNTKNSDIEKQKILIEKVKMSKADNFGKITLE